MSWAFITVCFSCNLVSTDIYGNRNQAPLLKIIKLKTINFL